MNSNTDLLSVLTREGVLINASVRYPRFHKKLNPADLGLEPGQVSERLMSLGHKRLLPREALAELALVESRTHALVERSTFPFLGGLGHFLPNGKLVEVQEQLNAQGVHFRQAQENFLSAYRDLRADALEEWREATRQLARSRDEAACLYEQIAVSFPAREKLAERFAFEVHLFQIAVPGDLGMELVTFAEQNEVRRARREASEAAARQIRAGVEGFVGDCVVELRRQTAQLCEDMLASMREGKTEGVHQKTLNRLTRLIEDFRQLNFAGDTEMEVQLDRVRRELLGRSAEDYRQNPSATRSLEAGLSQLRDHARELAGQDARELVERFGQMGRRKLQLAG
jgi:hypothetical protein